MRTDDTQTKPSLTPINGTNVVPPITEDRLFVLYYTTFVITTPLGYEDNEANIGTEN